MISFQPVRLTPIQEIEFIDNGPEKFNWKSDTSDPQLALEGVRRWREKKRYRLRFCKANFVHQTNIVKLYFNTGSGFNENESLSTTLENIGNTWEINFRVPANTLEVRFDPAESYVQFTYQSLKLDKFSELQWKRLQLQKFLVRKVSIKGGFNRLIHDTLDIVKRSGLSGLIRTLDKIAKEQPSTNPNSVNYKKWVITQETDIKRNREEIAHRIRQLKAQPLISIIVPTYNTPPELLIKCIQSVNDQIYTNWQLCIADDCSTNSETISLLKNWANSDPKIDIIFRKKNGHISAASNSAADLARGEWIVLLDHDDELAENALSEIVFAINENSNVALIYSDEDKIDINGNRKEPYFKTDWNYHLFLSQNMFSHIGVYKTDIFNLVGGFRAGFEGAQDYDLALRCIEKVDRTQIHHIPKILYHWRQLPGSTSITADEKPYAMIAGERALNEHFERTEQKATANLIGFGYQIKRKITKSRSKVSIVIPTKDNHTLLRRCVESIFEKTNYEDYEIIIVDNGSTANETKLLYEKLLSTGKVILLEQPGPFNFSKICNFGASRSSADFLLFLNNDTEVINDNWITEMVSIASQNEVGVVGARLWYPNDTLQHCGLVLSPHHIAMNAHRLSPMGHHGYFGRATLTHECSAVTGACLMVRRNLFIQAKGFDEVNLKVAYNDVDFCLRLGELGYKCVSATFAELYHHESATRPRDNDHNDRYLDEKNFMLKRWGVRLANDPMYNPNLSLMFDDFRLN